MPVRGKYGFASDGDGRPSCNTHNERLLRRLLVDWRIIDGHGGPGTRPDGRGAWHVFCHLAAAAAVFERSGGGAVWVGVIFDAEAGGYTAAACWMERRRVISLPLSSPRAVRVLSQSRWRGYLEGASRGRILHRLAQDPGDPATADRRQDYDQNPNSPADGGPVWEFWTVSRDIVRRASPGRRLVSEYLRLLSFLGPSFLAVVARGRSEAEYGHLRQLCAFVDAGLISAESALVELRPRAIPQAVERVLLDATPQAFVTAATELIGSRTKPVYHMYERRMPSFAGTELLCSIARSFEACRSRPE
jgi:hypothetical protein